MVLFTWLKYSQYLYYYRFKINLEKYQLKIYINMILEVLKQTISSDLHLVRTFKSDDKSAPHSVYVPTLLNDNIYEPNHVDISQVNITFWNIRFFSANILFTVNFLLKF